jgi:hypothetical protein
MADSQARRRPKKSERSPRGSLRIARVAHGPEVTPGVVSASLEDVMRAVSDQAPDLDWATVADNVIPVMPRIRPLPTGFPQPLRVVVEPGVAVGYAIDIGPAFMGIDSGLIRSWDIPLADVQARALANTISRAGRIDLSAVHDGSMDGTPTRWLQTGQSIGSVLILVPDELRRIFGAGPAFFITPMRDLIIRLPADVDRQLAAWLWLEVASMDPNCVGPIGYRFDGWAVAPESLDEFLGVAFDLNDTPGQAYVA